MIRWCVNFATWKGLKQSIGNYVEFALPNRPVFCSGFILTGRSVVWLARLLWEQEAVSSNLTVPTISDRNHSLYFPNEIRWSNNYGTLIGSSSRGWLVQKNLRVPRECFASKRRASLLQFHSLFSKNQWTILPPPTQIRWDLVFSLGKPGQNSSI